MYVCCVFGVTTVLRSLVLTSPFAALCLAAVTITACAPPPQAYSSNGGSYNSTSSRSSSTRESATVQVKESQFEPRITFVGIDQEEKPHNINGTFWRQWFLRS